MTTAIFFSGPIGAGKTTLGRSVAGQIDAAFIDGDDHADQSRPWFASSRSTNRNIADAALSALQLRPAVVIAYPLRCTSYVYFRRRMTDAGHLPIFVTLRASAESILTVGRGREFGEDERARIFEMIAQGYADRPFSDHVVDTDAASFDQTVDMLLARLMPLLA